MRFSFYIFLLFLIPNISPGEEVAITIDDAPHFDSPAMKREDRVQKIIEGLKASKVEEAMFFVVGSRIDQRGRSELIQYANAGHRIANHTFSHRHPDDLGVEGYILDIKRNHEIIKDLPNFINFFRYPFLDQGKTKEMREAIRKKIEEMNYRIGYVSLDTADWDLNAQYEDAIKNGKKVDMNKLRDAYLSMIWDSSKFYATKAKKLLGRSVKHTVLLHENSLLALFLSDLISLYREKGWTIIRATDAFKDPIYSQLSPGAAQSGDSILNQIAIERKWADPEASIAENHLEVTRRFQTALE